MSTSSFSARLTDVLDDLIRLRTFPATASRLMAACDRPDVNGGELCEIIQIDPCLTVKLLQVANSPLYGFAGEIRSVQHATVVLGLRSLKNLALSMAMGEVFGNGGCESSQIRSELWSHSLGCGSIARTLAAVTGAATPDEAFLAGVVHDVGKLLMIDHEPEQYATVLSTATSDSRVDLEKSAFGIAHTDVGGECGRSWGLPDEIVDVISFHHNPDEADFGGDLVSLTSAANQLTKLWLHEHCDGTIEDASEILRVADVDMSPAEIVNLRDDASAEFSHVRKAYSA